MALTIKDPVTEKLARDLARRTGEDITTAIRRALEERLYQMSSHPKQRLQLDSLVEIRRRWAAMPKADSSSADEVIDYDQNGLPR